MTNSKSTKRALLSSILALVLCFAMLLGTTFAWFTDTAKTSVNKIQAGTLDIQLLDEDGNSLENKTLDFVKAEGHENEDILWEPGCTYNLQPITIKNNGNLALKYKVVISGINGDAKLNEAIEWTININEEAVTDGEMIPDGHALAADSSDLSGEYYLLPEQTHTLTISGHMLETAGNEYQGLSIDNVSITVVATQYTYEHDSTTHQYDKDAVKVFGYGDDVNNITLKSTVVDSNRIWNNLYEEDGYSANGHHAIVFNQQSGDEATFEDCIFLCDVGNVYSVENGTLTFKDCTFYGWVHFGGPTGADITFENCTFTSTCDVKIGGGANSVNFKNCTFETKDTIVDNATEYIYPAECGRIMIWSDATFTDCTILREVCNFDGRDITYTNCVKAEIGATVENTTQLGNAAYVNSTFENTVYLNNSTGDELIFVGCTFNGDFGNVGQAVVNGTVKFVDCTFNAGFHIDNAIDADVTLDNCRFNGTSWFKLGSSAASVVVKNTTFEASTLSAPWGHQWLIAYSDITFENCTMGRVVRAGSDGMTVTLTGCVNGTGNAIINNEGNSAVHGNASPTVVIN